MDMVLGKNCHSLTLFVDKAHVSAGGYVFHPSTVGVQSPDVLPKGWFLFDGQAISGAIPPNGLARSVVPCHAMFDLANKPSDFRNQSSRAFFLGGRCFTSLFHFHVATSGPAIGLSCKASGFDTSNKKKCPKLAQQF